MSKIVILKNQTYLSSKSIYHNLEGGGRVSLENALNHIYPIGSIFITTVNQDPSPYLGGKWEAFGAGRVLVGFDSSQTEFNTILKTGGEKTHKLTIYEMPSHIHSLGWGTSGRFIKMTNSDSDTNSYGFDFHKGYAGDVDSNGYNFTRALPTGGGQSHNNLQPYIVVYMFKRIS